MLMKDDEEEGEYSDMFCMHDNASKVNTLFGAAHSYKILQKVAK